MKLSHDSLIIYPENLYSLCKQIYLLMSKCVSCDFSRETRAITNVLTKQPINIAIQPKTHKLSSHLKFTRNCIDDTLLFE